MCINLKIIRGSEKNEGPTLKLLVFNPGHAIWAWGFPAGLTAETLMKRGHEILYLQCDREYQSFCMAQASMGVRWMSTQESRDRICTLCKENAQLVTNRLKLPTASINSFITSDDRKSAEKIVRAATPKNFQDIHVLGIPVGRLAMYEFIIQNMKSSISFENEEWNHYCAILENACKATYGFARACEQYRPEICLIEHTSYSYNRACQMIAEAKGIPAYFLNENSTNVAHGSELLLVSRGDPLTCIQHAIEGWEESKNIPVSLEEARFVTDHFIALIKAKGRVFSSAKRSHGLNVRKKFKIRTDQKILLAMTSSYDEMFAAETVGNFAWNSKSDIFEVQTDWIRALLAFVRERPELFLIIRVHPREFMAMKNGGLSEHAQTLMRELKDLPSNAAVNWPTDQISIYDLMEETAVGLNAWSTAGSELSFFGIPVVVYCGHLLLYPASLNYSASSFEEYFRFIDQALIEGWSFERVRTLYRWYATLQVRIAANISDSFPNNVLKKRSFFERAYFKFRRIFSHQFDYIYCIEKRSPSLASGGQIERLLTLRGNTFLDLSGDGRGTSSGLDAVSQESETLIIRGELKRLYNAMYGGLKGQADSTTLRTSLRSIVDT